ncbi:MAG TPA: alpha-glucan family phosphorylase, partial [Longimicrobiales bacterium]|nr:alpha-glucan family phosphorylase [Longimicrobiales bacterium]
MAIVDYYHRATAATAPPVSRMMMSDSYIPLPAELSGLRALAANLRWGWRASTRDLFESIDPRLWHATGRNPVRLLRETPAERFEALARDPAFVAAVAAESADLWNYLSEESTWWAARHYDRSVPGARIAYFSAEFAIVDCLPIFSGGLGVLAGDHLKSASDMGVPLVGVGLLYREGYFRQEIDGAGRQQARYVAVTPADLPIRRERNADGTDLVVSFPMLDRRVSARVWRADVGRVKLYLLDTDIEANIPEDRNITDRLYGGDGEHRLRQEIVLGIGGMRALAALGITPTVIHLNEGHAAFAAIERARQVAGDQGGALRAAAGPLAQSVVFTTHTPVPAGHDHFPPEMVDRYLGGYVWEMHESWDAFFALGQRPMHRPDIFCMTTLAMRTSGRRNGVSR